MALRLSAIAARDALATRVTGGDGGAPEPLPGDGVPRGTVPPAKGKRRELSWITLIAFSAGVAISLVILIKVITQHPPAHSDASAGGSLRTINTACVSYSSTFETVGFPPTLENLGPATPGSLPTAERADLIDGVLASGAKSGYRFRYVAGPRVNGVITTYTVNADPTKPGVTGVRHFFTDQTTIIRVDAEKPATAESPPIG